jgi:tRNA U34 5-methylaminomethyl-2-thiouridine-forming methyltransferase MnmC
VSNLLPEIEIEFFVDDLRNVISQLETDFHLIFHDPFSPPHAPHLWSVELFQHYARLLQAVGGCLLTYSGAASVRGGLLEAGFNLLKTSGVGGKTGGTIGFVQPPPTSESWSGRYRALEEWEENYLQSRAGIPFRDATLKDAPGTIAARREEEQKNSTRPSGSTVRGSSLSKTQRLSNLDH